MTTQETPVDGEHQLDYGFEDEEEDWQEDYDELPPRPRRKLLSPVPATLIALLLLAGGFLGGVLVEKGQSSSGTSGGFPAGLAALRGGGGGTSSSSRTPSGGGFPSGLFGGGGAGGGVTTGEVSFVSGNTLYISSGENTVKVTAPTGTKVSKTVSTGVNSIHPGDTVIVRGTQGKDGKVTASSISISSTGSGTGTGGSSGASAASQLFGSG